MKRMKIGLFKSSSKESIGLLHPNFTKEDLKEDLKDEGKCVQAKENYLFYLKLKIKICKTVKEKQSSKATSSIHYFLLTHNNIIQDCSAMGFLKQIC